MSGKPHGQRQRHHCVYGGTTCTHEATCLPQLFVPAFKVTVNPDLLYSAAMLGFYLCENCFRRLTAKEILSGDRGAPIREAVIEWFRVRGSSPNLDKATVGRISGRENEFGLSEDIMEKHRAN